MSTIGPDNGSSEPPPPDWQNQVGKWALRFLKVIGVVALVLLVVAGIALGTCMYLLRN
jgi:hypothetical protein